MLGGKPLSEQFDLIYGTSTGAIIASLLALGKTVDEIHGLYKAEVPPLNADVWIWHTLGCSRTARGGCFQRSEVRRLQD